MKKRILSVILALAMLLPVFAVGTFALTPEEEAKQCMAEVFEIFSSGKITLKARIISPFGGNKMIPLTIAIDGDRMAFEMPMDWGQLFQADGNGYLRSMFLGWIAQLIFGKKMRFITKTDGMAIAFPDKKMYLSMTDDDLLDFDWADALAEVLGAGQRPDLSGLTASEPTIGGKKYLCATVEYDYSTVSYFFLNGEPKRIEANAEGESVMWEIDMLSGQVEPAFFSTAGMRTVPISFLLPIGNLF